MRSCHITQGDHPGTLWWPRGLGGGKEVIYVYYNWFEMLYGRNHHNIVKQFASNYVKLKIKLKKIIIIWYKKINLKIKAK